MKSLPAKNKGRFLFRVQPGAKHEGWVGLWNDTHYKVALRARAVDGKANEALIDFLSTETGAPKSAIHIVSGQTNRCKVVEIDGVSELKAPANPCK